MSKPTVLRNKTLPLPINTAQVNMILQKQGIIQLVVDLVFLLVVAIPFVVVHKLVKPFQRGFFCDDQSIQYPYKPDTVTISVCAASFILAGVLSFVLVEAIFGRLKELTVVEILWNIAKVVLAYMIGAGISSLLTQVGKLSIGRLRPHFIAVCNPDFSKINCSAGYITDFTCLNVAGYSEKIMVDAHQSFPSGHSSFSAYCAFFLAIYYYQRLSRVGWSVLLKVVLQIAVAVGAFYTICSRVSDYKHHWSDVLIGALLGMFVAIWTAIVLGRHLSFFGRSWWGQREDIDSDVEMTYPPGIKSAASPMNSQANAEFNTLNETY